MGGFTDVQLLQVHPAAIFVAATATIAEISETAPNFTSGGAAASLPVESSSRVLLDDPAARVAIPVSLDVPLCDGDTVTGRKNDETELCLAPLATDDKLPKPDIFRFRCPGDDCVRRGVLL